MHLNEDPTRSLTLLWAVGLAACDPTDAVVGTKDDTNESTDETGTINDGQEPGDTAGDIPETLDLASGEWVTVGVRLLDDPCDWDNVLSTYYTLELQTLLPEVFDLTAADSSFDIQARGYGASSAVRCAVDGEAFSCGAQSVTPEAYSLGYVGWLYEIQFDGQLHGAEQLSGVATVSFPRVAGKTLRTLEYYGIDPDECAQVWELELQYIGTP